MILVLMKRKVYPAIWQVGEWQGWGPGSGEGKKKKVRGKRKDKPNFCEFFTIDCITQTSPFGHLVEFFLL